MERSYFLLILLHLVKLCTPEPEILARVQFQGKTVKMINVTIENEQDARSMSQYSNYSTVQFLNPSISTLTIEMLDQLPQLISLGGFQGHLDNLQLSSQLTDVDFFKTRITSIEIDPTRDYQLKKLGIREASLDVLPRNLKSLKHLEYIGFERNQIEHIDTDDLSGLLKLQKLNLQHNRISRITSSPANPVNLPNLAVLYLFANQLTEISFEHWIAPSLKCLELDQNRLPLVNSLFSALPSLERIKLQGNPLNCHWKDLAYKELTSRRVHIVGQSQAKCSKADPSVGIRTFEADIFQARQNKLLNGSSSFRMQTARLEQSERRIGELEESIRQSSLEVQRLQSSNRELFEAFRESEREVGELRRKLDRLEQWNDRISAVMQHVIGMGHLEDAAVEATVSENDEVSEKNIARVK